MPNLLMVDAARERVDAWRPELEAAGYRIATSASEHVLSSDPPTDVIVLAAPDPECRAWAVLESLRVAPDEDGVPVVAIVAAGALDDFLRAAIEGAVRCLAEPVEPGLLVATIDAVLAPDAPPLATQRRRARQRALSALARIESRGAASDDDDQPRSVHLTRLEQPHGHERAAEAAGLAEARRRVGSLTTKQRGLLHVVEVEGSVAAAAVTLGTSRGNVYAGLRRIVHRIGVRDTGELLRLVTSGDLLRAARS